MNDLPNPTPYVSGASARLVRIYSAASLHGTEAPPRRWLVDGLIPSENVTLLAGDGGTGKSLVALQLAVAVASGSGWLGHTTSSGGALYVSAEDDEAELHRRLSDIERHTSTPLSDMERLNICSLAGQDGLLAALEPSGKLRRTDLFHQIAARIQDDSPALVVFDTLADLFPGNENDRAQARQFIGMLRGLAINQDCAVILLAHPSLSGLNSGSGTSGSTGWSNSVRSRLYLERVMTEGYEANPDARVLRTMKTNYGRTGGQISLTWQQGVFVADEAETRLDRMAGNAKAERVFLSLLTLFQQQGRRVNHAGGVTYAPRLFAEHPACEGMTKRALKGAMEALLQVGKIRIAEDGPPSKRRTFIEAVS